jgi:hypothetical protein
LKTWTVSEICTLVDNYNLKSNSELTALIPNKSPIAIYKKAYKLGLRKCPEIEYKNRSEANCGDKSSNWRGGKRSTSKGYRQVLCKEHPRADSSGYVMEHILVWEKESGISVPEGCCVHHINGDKSDNRIENLCLMVFGAHTTFHNLTKRKKVS